MPTFGELKQQLHQLSRDGSQDEFFALFADLNRRLAKKNLTEDKQVWCDLQKHIMEPAFLRLVLLPAGHSLIQNPDIYGVDFLNPQRPEEQEDVKFQPAPFFTRNPVYTFTLNFDDTKYTPTTIVNMHHYRKNGYSWLVKYSKEEAKDVLYDGPDLSVICRPTMQEITRQIKWRGIERRAYKNRVNDDKGNEKFYFPLDIRWFNIWRRRVDQQWVDAPWTTQEKEGVLDLGEDD